MAGDAEAAPLAAVHHRRQLRLLRLVGLALHLPARRLHALEPAPRRPASTGRTVKSQRKALLVVVALAGNLGVLGYFKYYDFFVNSSHNLAATSGWTCRSRCGRSSCRSASPSSRSWRSATSSTSTAATSSRRRSTKFAVYLSFFPHLVAGPIVRPGELLPQIETPRDPRRVDTSRAFYLIATGLFKKVVIANYLAVAHRRPGVRGAGQHSSLEILVGDLRVRRPDLRRLLRLHRHRDRARAAARLPVPAELRLAVRGASRCRTSGAAGT